MTISADDVRHVARLARIELAEDELAPLALELGSILDHIGKIGELDLSDVEPTTHALAVTNVLGADEPHTSLTTDQALANAPDAGNGMFRVGRIG